MTTVSLVMLAPRPTELKKVWKHFRQSNYNRARYIKVYVYLKCGVVWEHVHIYMWIQLLSWKSDMSMYVQTLLYIRII